MTSSKKLLFLSASERWNLGDLLFPIVFKHYTDSAERAFVNVGLTSYSPQDEDTVPVDGIDGHLDPTGVSLVIGGGEVLGGNLPSLSLFLHQEQKLKKDFRWSLGLLERLTQSELLHHRIRSFLLHIARSIVAKGLQPRFGLPPDVVLPFYVAVLPTARRFYLPVGGQFPTQHHPIIQKSLRNTVVMAGRDRRTCNSFPIHKTAKLAPDPVSTIGRVFPAPEGKIRQVVVQFSMHKLAIGLDRLQHLLQNFLDRGYKVVGLAIGRCPGHHDISSIEELAKRLPDMNVSFNSSVREAVKILAESEVYIGTSLHGAILSHAYGNAVLAMDEKVPKLQDYLNTWMENHALHVISDTEDDEIATFVAEFETTKAMENASKLAAQAEDFIQEVIREA